MEFPVDDTIKKHLNEKLLALESNFGADIITHFGPFIDGCEKMFLKIVEDLATDSKKQDSLYILLTTSGGSAIAVKRIVNIIRHHYEEVHFVIPDYAYSAGTIFCMSGDSIHMDYYSVLGPIDPQIQTRDGHLVPALGYLDKVKELVEKARNSTLTQAEFVILKDMDLAELRGYEQAKEFTIDLLKKWLVRYKFQNWTHHRTNPDKIGKEVTEQEKQQRAKEIADKLSDNNQWKLHSQPLNIEILEKELRLEIDDYSNNAQRKEMIREYHHLLADYIQKNDMRIFIHTRRFI